MRIGEWENNREWEYKIATITLVITPNTQKLLRDQLITGYHRIKYIT